MSTTAESSPAAPPVRREPVAVCAAVGLAVAVGWVLYRHYWYRHVQEWALRPSFVRERLWVVALVIAMALCIPYALALLAWGRRGRGRLLGTITALAAGLYFWSVWEFFSNVVWDDHGSTRAENRAYVWITLLGLAVLVPLAWGLARRTGRGWRWGVLVGPLVSGILRELELRWSWWHDRVVQTGSHYHWQLQAAAYVAPFVLAVLACWAIEARGDRQAPSMRSSA